MAWIKTEEVVESATCDHNEDGNYTFQRYFLVFFDSLLDRQYAALTAPLIPSYKSIYTSGFESLAAAKCVNRQVAYVAPKVWGVTCSYSTNYTDHENPLDRPVEYSWSGAVEERVVDVDVETGRAVLNSAGDPFLNMPTVPFSHSLLTVVRNEASYSELTARTFRNKVNDATWNTFEEKRVRCDDIQATKQAAMVGDTRLEYWQVTYTFMIHADKEVNGTNHDSWRLKLLDQGYSYLVGGRKVQARNGGDLSMASEPVMLNGAGGKLNNPSATTATFKTFDVYATADFSQLNITL